MLIPYDQNLKKISQALRRNMTRAEMRLWERLKSKHLNFVFYRQKPIGNYIVDFYCNQAKLVVEVDGEYHTNNQASGNDIVRDVYMKSLGLKVLRFPNDEVLNNIDAVVAKIRENLANPFCSKSSSNPPLQGGRTRS